MMKPNVGLVVTTSLPEVGSERAPAILAQAEQTLRQAGMAVSGAAVVSDAAGARAYGASVRDADALCAVAATWSEDFLVQDILSRMAAPVPVIAWGLPDLHSGSLCGTQQLCCVLKELGCPHRDGVPG